MMILTVGDVCREQVTLSYSQIKIIKKKKNNRKRYEFIKSMVFSKIVMRFNKFSNLKFFNYAMTNTYLFHIYVDHFLFQ